MDSGGFPLLLPVLVVAAVIYLRGWLQLRSASVNFIPAWRAGSLLLGLCSIWVAVASPLAAFDHELLTVHMIQHLLLMTAAAPLILLGAPVMALLHALPRRFVRALVDPLFRRRRVQQLGRALAEPVFCWLAATAALVGWHVPSGLALALHSDGWHVVQHASFLATGLLFWWPVVQPWPSVATPAWSTVLYLFLATLPCDVLSAFLVFSERIAYPVYLSTPRHFGLSVLDDQQCAGALMWTCVTIVYLMVGTMLSMRLLTVRSLGVEVV
jgi:cytochrome c oxidase assembly factor CtaG